jgi:RNA polymerase sigma-70 factor (family 1)
MKFSSIDCTMNTQISTFQPEHSKRFSAKPSSLKGTGIDDLFLLVAQRNDYRAFEEIFNKTYKSLCNFSNRFVHSLELSEEIVDDVFYSFWKNRTTIKINTSFTSYLLVSVRNRSLDCLRRNKNVRNSTLSSIPDQPCLQSIAHETMVYDELNKSVEVAIQSLAPQCRKIFLMSRDRELTYREIAAELNLSIKTVDTQWDGR